MPGGADNTADGAYSFAAGRLANTNGHAGTFVFGDSTSTAITAQNNDEVRSQMPMYAPSFNTTSARAAKTDIEPINPQRTLDGVESLDIHTWTLAHRNDGRHIGPMAEDFHDTFEVGDDDETIATVDADGVAFAAIQGLSARLAEEKAELDREITELRGALAEKDDRIASLHSETEAKEKKINDLVEKLATLKAEVGTTQGTAGDECP